jgi:hypothetical protein
MARNQKNFIYQTYVDDFAVSWNKRGEIGGAGTGIDGTAALVTSQPVWEERRLNRVRRVVAQDPTTGRKISFIVYTPTAYSAITKGQTIAVQVTGLATTVDYDVTQKIAEKQRLTPAFTNNLAD